MSLLDINNIVWRLHDRCAMCYVKDTVERQPARVKGGCFLVGQEIAAFAKISSY